MTSFSVAALKCHQRKKQWLANLQAKVEMYGTENDALDATVQSLREEIVSLKILLLAHEDCPVARANGVQLHMASMAAGAGEYGHVSMMQSYPGMMAGVMHQQPPGEWRYS
jgi:ATF/CREB family transcription factor